MYLSHLLTPLLPPDLHYKPPFIFSPHHTLVCGNLRSLSSADCAYGRLSVATALKIKDFLP